MAVCARVCQRALLGDGVLLRATASTRTSPLSSSLLQQRGTRVVLLHSAGSHGQLLQRQQQASTAPSRCLCLPHAKPSITTHSELHHELQESSILPAPRKRHLCYYFSQGLCTLENDPLHLAKFTHDYPDLNVDSLQLKKLQPQPFQYYLVLDLEGMVEILEFPVVMIDAKTLQVVDRFHRFVRPIKMSEARIDEYIEGKYGRWGLDRVWHDTAIPFTEVLQQFEKWMQSHGIWDAARGGKMKQAAFVTCGNWDVKTKIPQQCETSSTYLPAYFWEWINLKDIYLNFYKKRAGGMLAMLKGLQMPMAGTHHVGLDDAHNIARVLQRILIDGGIVKVTAKRSVENPSEVKFRFKFRVK
eukprot:c20050_g1_i2 orf=55-1125(+)